MINYFVTGKLRRSFFTARRYASAVYAVTLGLLICRSVCPVQGSVLSKHI